MSELKPCPFCNGEARIMLEEEDRPDDSFHNVYCTGCGAQFWVKSKSEAEQKWNRRAQPANEPLTLEQLREMDGEPVWAKHFAQTKFASAWIEVGEYGLVDAKLQRIVFMKNAPVMFEKYKGDFAIAYRRKPERSENDG